MRFHSQEKRKNEADSEKVITDFTCDNVQCLVTKYVPNEVGERYKFSMYLVDPNKFRFRTVIRIVSIVLLFLQKNCNKLGRS